MHAQVVTLEKGANCEPEYYRLIFTRQIRGLFFFSASVRHHRNSVLFCFFSSAFGFRVTACRDLCCCALLFSCALSGSMVVHFTTRLGVLSCSLARLLARSEVNLLARCDRIRSTHRAARLLQAGELQESGSHHSSSGSRARRAGERMSASLAVWL